jgi:hypothetical protein
MGRRKTFVLSPTDPVEMHRTAFVVRLKDVDLVKSI